MEQTREDATEQLQRIVQQAFVEAPAIYANGFVNGVGLTDAYLVLQTNGRSTAVVNLSLPVAKSLSENLQAMVRAHEQKSGQKVRSLEELQQG
jgi:hypothetical protein